VKKRTAKALTLLAVFVLALSAVYAFAVAVSAAKLRKAYAELEKDGRPMQAPDIIPPRIPDSENAALLYQSAILLLKAQPAELGDLLSDLSRRSESLLKGSIEPNELASLEELIRQDAVSEALAILQRGTSRPGCRFDRQYNAGFRIDLPVIDLRHMAQILYAKARIEARAGRHAAAWELARTQLKFADALQYEPIVISQLVRWRMIRLACETIQAICEAGPPEETQLADLMNSLQTLDDIRPLLLAADGDRLIVGEWLFNLPRYESRKMLRNEAFVENDMSGLHYWALFHWITFRPIFLADHAAYLRATCETSRMIERPYSPDDKKELTSRRHALTHALFPGFYRVREICLESTAQTRITRAGLALLQYKQRYGAFPPTLGALDVKNLDDPFIDQPLRYRAEPEGFVLYSVGTDQKDNGGVPKPPESDQKTDFDLVWRFPNRQ
jgi:hypothetical protein